MSNLLAYQKVTGESNIGRLKTDNCSVSLNSTQKPGAGNQIIYFDEAAAAPNTFSQKITKAGGLMGIKGAGFNSIVNNDTVLHNYLVTFDLTQNASGGLSPNTNSVYYWFDVNVATSSNNVATMAARYGENQCFSQYFSMTAQVPVPAGSAIRIGAFYGAPTTSALGNILIRCVDLGISDP